MKNLIFKKAAAFFISAAIIYGFTISALCIVSSALGISSSNPTNSDDGTDLGISEFTSYVQSKKDLHTASSVISPGLSYSENIFKSEDDLIQRSYVFDYTPSMGTEVVPQYGEYLYGVDNLKSMVESASQDGRVVGGINGDFFSLKTGVPMSCLIDNSEIISSDDARYAIGFDSDGKAFISKPNLSFSLIGKDKEYIADHLNKYPTQYALYLLSDKFSQTTHTEMPSREIVLMPYNKALPKTASANSVSDTSDNKAATSQISSAGTSTSAETGNTLLAGETVDNTKPNLDNYIKTDAKMAIGAEINFVVTEIRSNSTNSQIPEGCFVLCAEETAQAYRTEGINVGDELTLKVGGNEAWKKAVRAMGSDGIIVSEGEYKTESTESHYLAANPRTAVGITADGRVIFYCVDGRRTGFSKGLTIKQLAYELISLGCITAVNLDGGGSTTVYQASSGFQNSSLKNLPSDNAERKVANSLLFVNKSENTKTPSRLFMYPHNSLVLKNGGRVSLSLLSTDKNFFPTPQTNEYKPVYSLNNDSEGQILNDTYISGNLTGEININAGVATGNGWVSGNAGKVTVIDSIDDFALSAAELNLSPVETVNIRAWGTYQTMPVYMGVANLNWNLDGNIPGDLIGVQNDTLYVDDNTQNTSESKSKISFSPLINLVSLNGAAANLDVSGNLTPNIDNTSFYIAAEYSGNVKYIKVNVSEYPFIDSKTHWAKKSLYYINSMGVMIGETTELGRYFYPGRNLSRAEFFAVLTRILNIDISKYSDVKLPYSDSDSISAWSLPYIKALYSKGYLDVLTKKIDGKALIFSEDKITRLEVMMLLGLLCPDGSEDYVSKFADIVQVIPDGQYNNINKCLSLSLFSGYEDGTLRPNGQLTRAEAATVLLRLNEKLAEISKLSKQN